MSGKISHRLIRQFMLCKYNYIQLWHFKSINRKICLLDNTKIKKNITFRSMLCINSYLFISWPTIYTESKIKQQISLTKMSPTDRGFFLFPLSLVVHAHSGINNVRSFGISGRSPARTWNSKDNFVETLSLTTFLHSPHTYLITYKLKFYRSHEK